ncbi:MAG: hypothetical protein EOL88_01995 [Bacteroidia bacterium]|nr:hypothetical protein [Bacteroidia bacterium]
MHRNSKQQKSDQTALRYATGVLIFIVTIFMLPGCNSAKFNKDAVARVGDVFLLTSEIKGLVPPGASATDSLQITRNYINTWIRKQTILQHAKKNLPADLLEFNKKLEDYKNSLIIYTYQKELIRQQLDTVVNEEEIITYYENNRTNFELKENILRLDYIIIQKDSAEKKLIHKLLLSDSITDRQQLEEWCKQKQAEYYLDEEEWIFFNDLIKYIPVTTYNQEQFLANNTYIELNDSVNYYYLRIKDYKIKESLSPLDFEKENIRMILQNKRKSMLLEKMEKELFDQALKSNKIELY